MKKSHKDKNLIYSNGTNTSTKSSSDDMNTSKKSISGSSKVSSHKKRKKRDSRDYLKGEFNKIELPIFDGEVNPREEVEAWLLGMSKYFQVYDYSSNMKAKVEIYNLNGKSFIWWKNLKLLNQVTENNIK